MNLENILAYSPKLGQLFLNQFSGFLKQVYSFIKFFRLWTSQNVDRVSSWSSQLKSPKSLMFSYCDDSKSISLR